MANLSQQKRERMLKFLETIKAEHTDDESIIALNEIENELNSKKYGLVWEQHEEAVDIQMRTHVPVFTEVPEREIHANPEDEGYNFLLEGDNLHSLKLLEKTHRGKIDIIYIDPPYNTGKNFTYNDEKIEKEDSYKNSKWLSFMECRLLIARNLLCREGIIAISIDDNEQAALKLLCDEIFGVDKFICCMPRRTKSSGKTTEDVSRNHDYILLYGSNKHIIGLSHDDAGFKYSDEYEKERGKYKLNQTLDYDSLSYSPSLDYCIEIDGEKLYPGGDYKKHLERLNGNHKRADWAWRWSKDLYEFGLEKGFIVKKKGRDGNTRLYTKTYQKVSIEKQGNNYILLKKDRTKPLSSIDFTEAAYSNDVAKKDISSIFVDTVFDYPKPVSLIKMLMKIYDKKNAMILDFFAGSGTTAQAVLELNAEDEGHRSFILATNNEENICSEVTYPRINTVITGKRKDGSIYSDGIHSNLKCFKTDFIAKKGDNDFYSVEEELNKHIKEMIELERGISIDNEKYLLILTDDDADALEKTPKKLKNCKAVYISGAVFLTRKQEALLDGIETITIPQYYFEDELMEVGEL